MNTIKLAVSLLALTAVAGCAETFAVTPVGTTTTTSALVCGEGLEPSADGRSCIASKGEIEAATPDATESTIP